MMMGLGLLLMLAVFGIPFLAILGAAIWVLRTTGQQNNRMPPAARSMPQNLPGNVSSVPEQRACAHCGAGLQAEWIHCPKCGALAGEDAGSA